MNETEWVQHQMNGYVHGEGWTVTQQSLGQDRFAFVREQVIAHLSIPSLILDVGCNDGSFSRELAERGHDVIGVDFPAAIAKLDPYHGCQWCEAQVDAPEATPLYHEEVDAVVALEILEHCCYDFSLLRSIYHTLKPGGFLFLTVPLSDRIEPSDHHLRFYPEHSMRKLLECAGFTSTVLEGREHSLCVRTQRGD